jgi:hypothetical protein
MPNLPTPNSRLDRLLTQIELQKTRFSPGEQSRIHRLLSALDRARARNPIPLIRLHEALLFLRAFPHGAQVLAQVEKMLKGISARIEELQLSGTDMSDFDTFESSGIAGTTMQDTLSFDVTRWLVRRLPGQVEIAWDDYEEKRSLGTVLPSFIPLLDDDCNVEADTPWSRWLRTAKSGREPEWLIHRIEDLPVPEKLRSVMYEALKLPIRWKVPNSRFSRTLNWRRPHSVFYHQQALITRREVSLADELAKPYPKLERLSFKDGSAITDMIREVMAVRYRELYGTTLADPRSVVKADMGRGVTIYLWNLPPERRLPLRAYAAGFTLKNGVPINYIEAIGLCEWIEIGFNTFYTFRDGETAWVYAQVLRCLRAHMRASCFSMYPYQIGKDNDEAIESGAFWFYRKLGFRPGRSDLLKLTLREEQRIASNSKYRTSARTLRRLAEDHVFYQLPASEPGAWDSFSARNLGLRISKVMAREFGGDDQKMRAESLAVARRVLGVNPARWTSLEQKAFEDWALVLRLVTNLPSWTRDDKNSLIALIRAKSAPNEMEFLRLSQRHLKFRKELLRLGSRA